jgi:hypothetical protein
MWQKKIKKTVFTLNLNPDIYKEITDLTYPLLKEYCRKIDADFYEIKERKFPEWKSPTYEKCQVYRLAQEMENDWNIFIDCDALVHPDTPDITSLIPKDTVLHNGHDFAAIRSKYDRFFLRDGRHIGSPTWLCVASDLCVELFEPVTDMTPEETYEHIFPTAGELKAGVEPFRLIEDFVFSRNIAKYGLKFETIFGLMNTLKFNGEFFFHLYAIPIEEKIARMKIQLKSWGLVL